MCGPDELPYCSCCSTLNITDRNTYSSESSSSRVSAVAFPLARGLFANLRCEDLLEQLHTKTKHQNRLSDRRCWYWTSCHSPGQVQSLHADGAVAVRVVAGVSGQPRGGQVRVSGLPQSVVFRQQLVQVVSAEVDPPRLPAIQRGLPPQRRHLDET